MRLSLKIQVMLFRSPLRPVLELVLKWVFLRVLDKCLEYATYEDIARELDVSTPTVSRWSQRLSLPHPFAQPSAIRAFRKMLNERR